MKHTIKITVFISILALFFVGCVKENFDIVPEKVYTVDFEANTTIAELKEAYSSTDFIKDDLIIKGTVISDDSHGNFYKKIVLQDSTGGIEIQIEAYDLYKKYPVGEMVYVKCKGLIIGDYKGVKQLTYDSNGSSERLPEGVLKDFLFRNTGEGKAIIPKVVKIEDLNNKLINTLIQLNNVEFVPSDTSKTYADLNADASRNLTDFAGNSLIVRTSSHADFAYDSIPKGNGSITAVYTVYNADKQINIRNKNEVNLDESRIQYLFEENFTTNLGQFITYDVLGSKNWYQSTHNSDKFAKISGYGGGANEDWLISNSVDLSNVENKAFFTFTHAIGYQDTWNDFSVWISSDYDGITNPNSSGNWIQITGYNEPARSGSFSDFESSGLLDISSFIGEANVRVAFKYTCGTSNAATWEISSVKIIAQ